MHTHDIPLPLFVSTSRPVDRAAIAPPSCNTGVQNSLGVDYVALSCSYDSGPGTFGRFFDAADDQWEELPYGGHGYARCRKMGNVRVYYDGTDGMGSYCQISGDGCRELEAAGKITDWQQFAVRCLYEFRFKGKRLDPFKDDRQGLLDIEELERKFVDGECTTHARVIDPRGKKYRGGRGKKVGNTKYIGSRKSDSSMRIYDKTLELRPNGRNLDEWRAEHGHHVRVELELRGKRAHAALVCLAQQGLGNDLVAGLIRGFIDFKDGDASGHNGRRVPTWAPWLEFLQSAAKVKLDVDAGLPTLAKAMHYHKQQWAPMLATEFMRLGGDKDAIVAGIMEVVQDGLVRRKPKHDRLLRQAA